MDTTGTLFLPPGSSTIAGEVDSLFYFLVYASIVLFAIVVFGMTFFALKYRHKKGQAESTTPDISHNTKLGKITNDRYIIPNGWVEPL